MSPSPERMPRVALLVLRREPFVATEFHQILQDAERAGISQIITLEPRLAGPDEARADVPPQKHPSPVRLHAERIGEPGAMLKMGLTYCGNKDFDMVAVWSGRGSPSCDPLRRMIQEMSGSDMAAIYAQPGPWGLGHLRIYRISSLRRIPYQFDTVADHFDFEVYLQLRAIGEKTGVVRLPGLSRSSLPSAASLLRRGRCFASVLRCRANRLALIYHPKFDFLSDEDRYIFKKEPTSLHQHVLRHPVQPGSVVVELGAGLGHISAAFHERGARVLAMDHAKPDKAFPFSYLEHDLEGDFSEAILARQGPADVVVMLDVIEHLADPEKAMRDVWRILKPGGVLLLSTGNIAYLPIRLMLLLGLFNYGRRGILDLTHRRLFTCKSMRRLLLDSDFHPEAWRGFGPPIADLIGHGLLWRWIDRCSALLARIRPSLFAYQIFVVATRREGFEDFMQRQQVESSPTAAFP